MMNIRCGIFLPAFFISVHLSFAQEIDSTQTNIKIKGYFPLQFSLTSLYGNETGGRFLNEAGFTAQAMAHSTAVNLPFSLALLRNDFITDEKKQDVSDHLEEKNFFELNYDVRFYGAWIQDSFLFHQPALYTIDFSSGNFIAARFTADAFNIIFFGNDRYAGQTVKFNETKFYHYIYNRIGFSAQKKIQTTKSNSSDPHASWEVGGKISLLTIRNAIKLNLPNATLFTEETGEYLDAAYNFELIESDSTNHGTLQIDGTGASVDLQLAWLNKSQTNRLSLYINNLGIARWNRQTRTFSADSMVHFEGLQVNNLFSFDTASFILYNLDSLRKNTGTKEKRASRTLALPVSFTVLFQHSLSQKTLLNAGVRYCPYADFLPMVFVKPQWLLSRSWQMAVVASTGGTENFAMGADAMVTIKKQLNIIFGSDNLLGLFIPKQTTSSSLFLQAKFQF